MPESLAQTLRRQATIKTIAIGRKLFANTPIERLPLTSLVLRRVFKFGYGEQDVVVSFRGLEVTVPVHADDVMLVPAIVGGFYEQIEFDVFTAIATSCRSVVDVGANIGLFAGVAAASMADGKVLAFEPVPANIAYLRRNITANGLDARVEIVEMAVSDEAGSASIYIADSIGTHSLSAANARSQTELKISLTTLDAWIGDSPVDLVKTDTEGFDAHVLRGGMKLLRKHRPTLFAEYTPTAMTQAGSDPAAYLTQVFDVHERVFLIDEPRGSLEQITLDQVPALAQRRGNYNLIAASRPDHVKTIEGWVTKSNRS